MMGRNEQYKMEIKHNENQKGNEEHKIIKMEEEWREEKE